MTLFFDIHSGLLIGRNNLPFSDRTNSRLCQYFYFTDAVFFKDHETL